MNIGQIVEHNQVGPITRSYRPQATQPEVFRRIDGGHLNGPDGVEPPAYRLSDHRIDVTIAQKIGTTAVINHKQASFEGPVGNQGEQGIQIPLRGALTDHKVHSPIQFLPRFLNGSTLVVGEDATG